MNDKHLNEDEINKALKCCRQKNCKPCPYRHDKNDPLSCMKLYCDYINTLIKENIV